MPSTNAIDIRAPYLGNSRTHHYPLKLPICSSVYIESMWMCKTHHVCQNVHKFRSKNPWNLWIDPTWNWRRQWNINMNRTPVFATLHSHWYKNGVMWSKLRDSVLLEPLRKKRNNISHWHARHVNGDYELNPWSQLHHLAINHPQDKRVKTKRWVVPHALEFEYKIKKCSSSL